MQIAIARIKIKLRILPTPRYKSMRNKDNEELAMSPRRELAKRSEKVNNKLTKINIKNKGTAPKISGSTK